MSKCQISRPNGTGSCGASHTKAKTSPNSVSFHSLASTMAVSPNSSSSVFSLRKPFSSLSLFPPNNLSLRTKTLFPKSPVPLKTLKIQIPKPIHSTLPDLPNQIPPQTLKSRLSNGDTLYGLFLLSFSPTLAEIAGFAGYDFVVIDMEHGPGGILDALPCLHALASAGTPAILRIPESSPAWAKKALDLGPQGIMFPMIENPKSAKKAVSYCRFPPNGIRGSAHTVVRASCYGINDGYLTSYEDELVIMCQVESEEGVKKIDEIAAVEGVDCIQMGPLDLSASLGYLWDPGNKKVKEVLRGAEKKVLEKGGAYLAGFAMPHDGPDQMRMRGYHMVSGAVDVGLFRSAVVDDVKRFKMGLVNEEEEDGEGKEEKYWSE